MLTSRQLKINRTKAKSKLRKLLANCNREDYKDIRAYRGALDFYKELHRINQDKKDNRLFILLENYIDSTVSLKAQCGICNYGKEEGFNPRPNNIKCSKGCPVCGRKKVGDKLRKTKEEFIEESNLLHNFYYTYLNVHQFKDMHELVNITCPLHGDFPQTPDSHSSGSGCNDCVNRGSGARYPDKPAILYSFRIKNTNVWKIGVTNNSLEIRYSKTLVRHGFRNIAEYYFNTGQEAYDLEQKLLKRYSKYKYEGEKLLRYGNTELLITNKVHRYLKRFNETKEQL